MAIEVAVDDPAYEKGTILDIGGVAVANGKTVKLTDEQELALVSRHRKAAKDRFADSETIKVTGSPKYGPSEVEKMFPPVEPLAGSNPYVDGEPEEAETAKPAEGSES
jgi:hypothetical protein